MKELADFFMAHHTLNKKNYTAKYQNMINQETAKETPDKPVYCSLAKDNASIPQCVATPLCTADISGFDATLLANMADENIANYENLPLYKALKQYRYEKSKAENIKAYYVFKNDELIEIIKLMPTAPEQLKSIRGFGEGKIQKYGNEIVNIVNKYR